MHFKHAFVIVAMLIKIFKIFEKLITNIHVSDIKNMHATSILDSIPSLSLLVFVNIGILYDKLYVMYVHIV